MAELTIYTKETYNPHTTAALRETSKTEVINYLRRLIGNIQNDSISGVAIAATQRNGDVPLMNWIFIDGDPVQLMNATHAIADTLNEQLIEGLIKMKGA